MAYRATTINYCPPAEEEDHYCGGHYCQHPVQWSPEWYTPYGPGAKTIKYGYPSGYWGGCSTPTGYVVAPIKPSRGISPYRVALADERYSRSYGMTAPYHMDRADSIGRTFGRAWQRAVPSLQTVDRYLENADMCLGVNEEPGHYLQYESNSFG